MADYPIFDQLGLESYRSNKAGKHTESNDRSATSFDEDVMDIMRELGALLIRKHMDYGPKNISDSPGGALNGLRVRMHDKLARINNLYDNDRTALNEPLEDSFKDLANYAVIALMVLRDKWDK